MEEPNDLEGFDDTGIRLGVSNAIHSMLDSLEAELGDKIPPEIREALAAKLESAAALAAEMAFREGRVFGELSKTDPRRALELMGGVDVAREKLDPESFGRLMDDVRKQEEANG